MELGIFAGTLKKGELLSKKKLVIAYIGLIISIIIPFITLGVILTIFLGAMDWNSNIITALVFINLFGVIIFLAILLSLKKYYNIKKTIMKCMIDSKKTIAFVRRVDIIDIRFKPYQVEFSFTLEGKEYQRLSPKNNPIVGYNKYFLKFVNQNIPILYSKKHDEIIILKNS